MRLLGTYVFSLLLIGIFGLCLGHMSCLSQITILKDVFNQVPVVHEKEVIVYKYVPLPVLPTNNPTSCAQVNGTNAPINAIQVPQAIALQETTNYMKQVAHVQVPQNSLSDVSKTLDKPESNVRNRQLIALYQNHLKQVMHVLKGVNHAHKAVRMRARLELAHLRVAGPLGRYVHSLADELLVRYCHGDGKLAHYDYDNVVQKDIENALEKLQEECSKGQLWGNVPSQESWPFARKVQQHPYNKQLMAMA